MKPSNATWHSTILTLGDLGLSEATIRDIEPDKFLPGRHSEIYGAWALLQKHYFPESSTLMWPRRVVWQHGWIAPDRPLAANLYEAFPNATLLVANQAIAARLTAAGWRSVKPIGLPFSYTQRPETTAVKESLTLVFPDHSIDGKYVQPESMRSSVLPTVLRRRETGPVAIVLHASDFKRAHLVDFWRESGFQCLLGADPSDRNSLQRIRTYLSIANHAVVGTTKSSTFAYAAACGLSISTTGKPKYVASLSASLLSGNRAQTAWARMVEVQEPRQLLDPNELDPAELQEWGAEQIGMNCHPGLEQMTEVLGVGYGAAGSSGRDAEHSWLLPQGTKRRSWVAHIARQAAYWELTARLAARRRTQSDAPVSGEDS